MGLLGREVVVPEEPQHAEHAGHRCADLMAHGGKEFRLGATGTLSSFARGRMTRHLALQLFGTLRHEFAKFLTMTAQLLVGAFALDLKRATLA